LHITMRRVTSNAGSPFFHGFSIFSQPSSAPVWKHISQEATRKAFLPLCHRWLAAAWRPCQ
jgi:hypothetical protein